MIEERKCRFYQRSPAKEAGKMASDEEIMRLWKNFADKTKQPEAIIQLYRLAEKEGKEEQLTALEKELTADSTIEAALKTFGWGRGKKESTITTRAIIREAFRLAKEKVK